ncbi:DUF1289 domain-containing protein [Neptunicella marina]|uniref:DUF1289 domain-containing protein n=1 Tax=Neptunicella marina TaxID=2125989 RepID=A0A8J6IT46_9ALTE|nr:DUF1289 domain-containing protein [Neptunicella marina]MBC3765330.1 DUF1289 domain-containing protein [Neptunicella marina]
MRQIEIFEIQSPCIGVCQSGPKGNCLGCFRTREERLYWIQLEDDVKRKIIKACAMRKKRAQAKSKTSEEPTQPPQQQSFWD